MKNLRQGYKCRIQNVLKTLCLWPTPPKQGFGLRRLDASVPSSRSGFTLLEVMIATTIFGLVVAGTISVYIMCNKIWHATSISMQTTRESSLALSRLVYGLETNNGLRAASAITLSTNWNGQWDGTNKYWETGAKPPPADNPYSLSAGSPDGSWRLTVSNLSGGIQYVDYNRQQRNILFWPDIAAMSKRIPVCNYVSFATVSTNIKGTVGIQLTVEKRDGVFVASNTVNTTVKLRNIP